MKKLYSILFVVCSVLCITGILAGLAGRAYCTRSNNDYREIQSESFVPDVIETVLHDETTKQIYVCYNDANCVNVYSEDGNFLWNVATPYIRNSFFELQKDKLIVYGDGAYIYNASNGSFIGLEKEENLNLSYDFEDEQTSDFAEGEVYFDTYQLYVADAQGNLNTIVSRPWWHWLFNFALCWCVSFVGTIGIGFLIFIKKTKKWISHKNESSYYRKKG